MTESVATRLARRIRASGRRHWTVDELRDDDSSSAAVQSAIQRLVKQGELRRVRRGLYWHAGSLNDARVRERRVRSDGAAARALLVDRPHGASGWQAANVLGLSTQVSPVEVIAVAGRPPRPVRGVRFVDRSARRRRRDQRLGELEVTLLEAIEGWERYVELPSDAAAARFLELLGSPEVRRRSLALAARTEPPAVRERLRALLERGGWHKEAALVPRAVDPRTRARALRVFGAP